MMKKHLGRNPFRSPLSKKLNAMHLPLRKEIETKINYLKQGRLVLSQLPQKIFSQGRKAMESAKSWMIRSSKTDQKNPVRKSKPKKQPKKSRV